MEYRYRSGGQQLVGSHQLFGNVEASNVSVGIDFTHKLVNMASFRGGNDRLSPFS